MSEAEADPSSPFPAPVRIDGYWAWTWKLFRACFLRLVTVFVAGIAFAALGYFGIVTVVAEVFDMRATPLGLAISFLVQVLLLTLVGMLLAAIATTVFAEQVAGRRVGADTGWRRLRPQIGYVVVGALYTAMVLLMLVLLFDARIQLFLLPLVLGPPVLVQAIVWERLDFRNASVRAMNLLAGNWVRVLAALVLLVLGAALAQVFVMGIAGAVVPAADELSGTLALTVVLILTAAPVWLFASAAGTVAYLDLRARFEELDREELTAEAEALEPAS